VTKSPAGSQYTDVSDPDRPPGAGRELFDAIYEAEFDYVWRTLGRLGIPEAEIPDAVHEVFVVLCRRWHELDRERPMRPWLFGVARRVAADLRAKRRELPLDIEPHASPPSDPLVAQRNLVWNALAMLDDDRRTVIILHDLEGHTGAEIAAMLEIPVNTVHSRLRLARAELVAVVRKLQGAQ
jgi:RNA polymerase sigma-70 factor (ECF subfamily)